jgi:hypothetical protein
MRSPQVTMSEQDHPPHTHEPRVHAQAHQHDSASLPATTTQRNINSALGWPALLRLLSVAPVVALLWALVYWANAGVATW